MSRLLAGAIALIVFASAPAQPAPLTLERIMADPDWIAGQIEVPEPFEDRSVAPYFSVDGQSVYYRLKRNGSPIRDLRRIELGDGKEALVDAAGMAASDGSQLVFDEGRTRAAYVRNGDVFLRELANGRVVQVTRSAADESAPQFSADGRKLSYRAGNDWFVYDVGAGVAAPAAILKTEKDPDAAPAKPDDLRDLQLRIFSTLKKTHDDKHAARACRAAAERRSDARAGAVLSRRRRAGRRHGAGAGCAAAARGDHAKEPRRRQEGQADALRDRIGLRGTRGRAHARRPQRSGTAVAVAVRPRRAFEGPDQLRHAGRHPRRSAEERARGECETETEAGEGKIRR